MDAIGLNPIKLDAIGLDPIRMNAIRLGVPGASSGSGRPYIDPELLRHVKMAISTWGKTNDDPDRAVLKDLSGNGNDMRLLNFGFTEGSGYGLSGTDFEGWLCTDGVDDLIESVKPVSEMLEGSNEITVVSIIHQISQIPGSEVNKGLNNQISYYDSPTTRGYLRNNVKDVGKTGIYGYTFNGTAHSVINNILGDKNDYIAVRNNEGIALNGVFSVCGYKNYYGELKELSSVAYAGGFIANKVLTTDEINQIIAYFNLDRPGQIIKPQLYCNIKKQGITNDNHAEFNDQLIDFVGGHNIQLNNISWEKQSGIGNYPISFKDYTYIPARGTVEINRDSFVITSNTSTANLLEVNTRTKVLPAYKVKIEGTSTIKEGNLKWRINTTAAVTTYIDVFEDGIYDIPATPQTEEAAYSGWCISKYNENVNVKVTILPEEGSQYALYLDGISDFGKATGLPILKDYTVAALRKWLSPKGDGGGLISKSKISNNGAFIIEQSVFNVTSGIHTYSFGLNNTGLSNPDIYNKNYVYQTRYSYNGNSIQAGTGVDSDSMWLGTIRDGDSRFSKFALWSLMRFPYSLSEFLLERQLRKYNAGTLYPGMVEFRPIVKSNVPYSSVSYSVNPGEYIAEGSTVTITITLSNETDKLVGVSSSAIADISISGDNGVYEVTGKVTKSPQKISIVISSYLTMLGNDTLILNETLIKNE